MFKVIQNNVLFLINSWYSSIKMLFDSKSSKLLLFGIYKTTVTTYKTVITKFWWYILLMFGSIYTIMSLIGYFKFKHTLSVSDYILQAFLFTTALSLSTFYPMLLVLITRPSAQRKTYRYYASFWKHFLIYIVLLLGCIGLSVLLDRFIINIYPVVLSIVGFMLLGSTLLPSACPDTHNRFMLSGVYSYVVVGLSYIFLINTLGLFFIADSDGTLRGLLRSFVKAVRMLLYNFPLFSIVLILGVCFEYIVQYGMRMVIHLIHETAANQVLKMALSGEDALICFIVHAFLFPFYIAVLMVLYQHRLHEQSEVYAGK